MLPASHIQGRVAPIAGGVKIPPNGGVEGKLGSVGVPVDGASHPSKPILDVEELAAHKGSSNQMVKSVGSQHAHTVGGANNVDESIFLLWEYRKHTEKERKCWSSILEILEEMISVGQTIGFSWKLSIKDMESIIDLKERMTTSDNLYYLKIVQGLETKAEKALTWRSRAFGGSKTKHDNHSVETQKRANLAVKVCHIDGEWDMILVQVKDEFRDYLLLVSVMPGIRHGVINYNLPNLLILGTMSGGVGRLIFLRDEILVLSNMGDRRFWDLNGDGCFRVKDVRRLLDDMLLPKSDVPSRWVKQIPIKVNVLAWKISMDRLPTRVKICTG
ncbi:hypothetical protein Tco_0419085 [Tanacetum coccineum]